MTLVAITPWVFHKYCNCQVREDPHSMAAASSPGRFVLLPHPTQSGSGASGKIWNSRDSCRHLRGPPQKSLPQEFDSEPHLPGRYHTVGLRTGTERSPRVQKPADTRESERPQAVMPGSAPLLLRCTQTPCNTTAKNRGRGWERGARISCFLRHREKPLPHSLWKRVPWPHS